MGGVEREEEGENERGDERESGPRWLREAAACLRLAAPIVTAQLSFVSMGAVDTILAGHLGAKALAAVAVGSNIWFLTFVAFMGLFMAISPLVAQRVGANRPPVEVGAFLRGALKLALTLGLAWTVALEAVTAPLLSALHLDRETERLASGYLHVIAVGALPYCAFFVLRNGADGHGLTRISLFAGLFGLALNAALGYVLMYGKLGLPALGPTGTACATVLAGCGMVAVYVYRYRRDEILRKLRVLQLRRLTAGTSGEILRVGLPIAAILVAESWLFVVGSLVMTHFGGTVVAANQVATNFAALTFIVPLSIGLATTVRVGQAAGAAAVAAGVPEIGLRSRVGVALGAGFALISAGAMILLPDRIVTLYSKDPTIRALATRFLLYAGLFQIFDGVQGTANGALRGLQYTRVPMVITVCAYWLIGFPGGLVLALDTPLGPAGIWWGFILGLAIAALGLWLVLMNRIRVAR